MKLPTNTPLLCHLQQHLRPDATYPLAFLVELLRTAGFAHATRLVGQLIDAGLFSGPVHALQLTGSPLAQANPAELQVLVEHLRHLPRPEVPTHEFSLFPGPITNLEPAEAITPYRFWKQLINPPAKRLPKLHAVQDAKIGSPEYERAKKALPYITPAGIFTTRCADGLVRASGLGVLDYDKCPNVRQLRDALHDDPQCRDWWALMFISVSRRGLKVLVRLPEDAPSYAEGLRAVHDYLSSRHRALGQVFDPSGLDISRACFVAHDPEARLHDDFLPTDR